MANDLLGDPIPETPPMTEPLPWRVFMLNDYEWYMARSLDEAKATAAEQWGYTIEQCERDELFDEAEELDDAALDRLQFCDDTHLPDGPMIKRSFREELARRSAIDPKPQLFASTEW